MPQKWWALELPALLKGLRMRYFCVNRNIWKDDGSNDEDDDNDDDEDEEDASSAESEQEEKKVRSRRPTARR